MPLLPQDAGRGRLWCFRLDSRVAFRNTRLPEALAVVLLLSSGMEREDLDDLVYLTRESPGTAHTSLLFVFGSNDLLGNIRSLIETKSRQILGHDIILLDRSLLEDIISSEEPREAVKHLVLKRADLDSVSPYTITGPVPDNVFFGREPELRSIVENAAISSYAVIGGRRVGKSSLLGRLHRIRLPAAGFHTLYHDCSNTPTRDDFLAAIISNWSPDPPSAAPTTFSGLLQAPPDGKPLVLLLDEADKLVPADRLSRWPLFSALRALANSGRAQIVLSGERTLHGALRDPQSPLFNFANEMLLGPLSLYAVEELVTRPMDQMDIELVDRRAIVECIWAFTSGHPNVVQRLCHRLIKRLNEQGTRCITLDDVNAIIEDPGFQREDFLSTYWETATSLEKIISLLIADDESIRALRKVRKALDSCCSLRPKAREVDDALQRLVDLRSILRRTATGYEFNVEAFPRVVAGTITLDDMLDILTEQYQEQGE